MEPESLYQHLKELAEKLGVDVTEANLKKAGIPSIKSGLCKIKDRRLFLMDKRNALREKIEVLTDCLSQMEIDDIYMIPAVREQIEKAKASRKKTDGRL